MANGPSIQNISKKLNSHWEKSKRDFLNDQRLFPIVNQ